MAKYIPYNLNQDTLVVVNFSEQLKPGTFEFALNYLIEEKLDLSIFDEQYKNDETGRPAYDPAILLKVILFAYSKGITSSRQMQWCCQTNILFKALSADADIHFTTLAHFISSQSKQIEQLFEQVLLICHAQGLLGYELFAIDGCKLASNAAKEWSGTFSELEQKRNKIRRQIQHHIKLHQQHDRQSTTEETQRTEQTIRTLEKSGCKIERFLQSQQPRIGQGQRPKEVKSNLTDNQSAKMTTSKGTIQGYNGVATVDKKHQIIVDAQAFGHGQEHHTLKPVLEMLGSRFNRLGIHADIYQTGTIVTADTGFANEANMAYLHQNRINGYIPDNQFRQRDPKFNEQKAKYGKRHQDQRKPQSYRSKSVLPASEFDFDPVNLICRCPANQVISHRGIRSNSKGQQVAYFEGKLLQCRNCNLKHQCMQNPSAADHRKGAGRQVSFVLNTTRKPTYTDWMKQRVDSAKGKLIYSHRMSVVEPVFGNLTNNKGLKRFSLRTQTKVQGQWQLFCMLHNIEKLKNYGQLG